MLAPIGIALNVVLIPLVAVALCFGFSGLLLGLISPALAAAPLLIFDLLLRLLHWITELASTVELGHLTVPATPLWWLLCFYVLAAAAMLFTVRRRRPSRVWLGTALWLMFGLALPGAHARDEPGELTCTVLSVGHGLSIVVELPDDRVLVYDCGSAGRPQEAALTLQNFLLSRGITQIDALLVSHSDADHFNGVELLSEDVAIGQVLLSRHFPDPHQPGTLALLDAADQRLIPVSIVARGDRLLLDPSVAIEVLHPQADDVFESDNAASVVLQIDFAGRRVLLTGDLEEDGLQSLLRQSDRDVDILLAPHHGALAASPPELAAWARPQYVVASARQRFDARLLETRYGAGTEVLTTSRSGAVTFRISPEGTIEASCFLQDSD